jgi:hypothetical protein
VVKPKGHGADRIFAVLADAAGDGEVELRQVLTWPSVDALRQQLLARVPMTSKEVAIGATNAPVRVGVRLPWGSEESWLVKLGFDRPVPPLVEHVRLVVLESRFRGEGNARVWQLRPRACETYVITRTAMGLALETASSG